MIRKSISNRASVKEIGGNMQGVSLSDINTAVNSKADFGNTLLQGKDIKSDRANISFQMVLSKAVTEGAMAERSDIPADYSRFVNKITTSKVPYAYLADDFGMVTYNGITFLCDEKSNALCLGDMSRKENVLTIPLSNGGCLKVNRDNLDGLSKAIGMFSPEDVRRILAAIATDAKVRGKQKEIADEVAETLNNLPVDNINDAE
jgi:hypothetical protein